jgi:cytochrome c-type biogenesis protein CcmE
MMNFNNKRTRKIVSSVIIILLVLAMVAPMVLGALSM